METILEEEEDEDPQMAGKQDVDDLDTIAYTPDEPEEEPFNTAIDDTSEDPTIVMGRPVTTTFISDDVRIPTEKVGCLQVTSKLQEFLNHFPPESKEKAFEQIYHILQVLDAYIIDNLQQHRYCMSPDSEYMLGSIYKLAPFINGAAPFSRLKMEQPFINRAAPFSSILSCSVYKWSCSIFKQLCKTYNNQFYLFKMIVICNCDMIIMKNTKTCISFI